MERGGAPHILPQDRTDLASGSILPVADTTRAVDAWVGCEFDSFKAIRAFLRKDKRRKKDQALVISYWRRGKAEDEFSEPEHD
ncbi:MAG: SIP domain-containing protein [Rhizobiaceae bacterium]|nr:SIP domain-containing protein [Rhizobiaceae bacterium]